jgi:chorismate mutase/prephenate dehydrogenase
VNEPDLKGLRRKIAEIDRGILELARERIDAAREIGHIKMRADLPLRDYGTERVVLDRTREYCEELGLPFELGEGVLHVLVEEAVRVQEELRERSPQSGPKRALVVGGGGGMGGWLCRYLEAQGHEVSVMDPRGAPEGFRRVDSLAESWHTSDVVALAVPLDIGPEVYGEILMLPPGPLVFDIFSLKSHVADVIAEAVLRGHLVASVHPMFGPTARLLSGRALIVCDTSSAEALARVRELFEATSLEVVEIPLDEHDRRMADVLGLSHAISLVFARALLSSPLDAREMAEVASTTFKKQMTTTREVVSENPELYYQIQRLNPHSGAALERLAVAVESFRSDVADGRPEKLADEMERARRLIEEL